MSLLSFVANQVIFWSLIRVQHGPLALRLTQQSDLCKFLTIGFAGRFCRAAMIGHYLAGACLCEQRGRPAEWTPEWSSCDARGIYTVPGSTPLGLSRPENRVLHSADQLLYLGG